MLTVFGSINIDRVIRVQSIARPGETVLGELAAETFGGKGANQAVAAARVMNTRGAVSMVGALGNDAEAEKVIGHFQENGVATNLLRRSDLPTGVAIIALDARGENAITLVGGANGEVTADQFSRDTIVATDTLLCQGETKPQETLKAVRAYKAARPEGKVIVNLAPVSLRDPAKLRELLEYTNYLVVNEHEAELVEAILKADLGDLSSNSGFVLVLTLGARGARVRTPDGEVTDFPPRPTKVVDTTGAGDTFVGIMAAFLTKGATLTQALSAATVGASLSCGKLGAQTGMPVREDLEAALAQWHSEMTDDGDATKRDYR